MFLTFFGSLTETDADPYQPNIHFSLYPCYKTNILFSELVETLWSQGRESPSHSSPGVESQLV